MAQHFAKSEAGCPEMYPELRRQLTMPSYDFRNGRILIEPKDEIKKRLQRSPDDADCYVMGVYELMRNFEIKHKVEVEHEKVKKYDYDPLDASKL